MKSFEITATFTSLSRAGTMQLRAIAKEMHVRYSNKLQRDELIRAIVAKGNEKGKGYFKGYLRGQQLELF